MEVKRTGTFMREARTVQLAADRTLQQHGGSIQYAKSLGPTACVGSNRINALLFDDAVELLEGEKVILMRQGKSLAGMEVGPHWQMFQRW